jgi:hypothetical protein
MFLGGDLSGRALVPIWRSKSGSWHSVENGREIDLATQAEVRSFERRCADRGLYAHRVDYEEYRGMGEAGRLRLLGDAISIPF